ncbi:Protein-ribulosamine 3-kinase, chloroplastic [Glycine max]|nr:Protein-ribulosamine 3-kinase, chloroplastic [Glycine max]
MTSAHVGAMSSSTCFSSLSRPLRPSFTKTKSSPKFSMSMSMSKDPVREWILSEGKATEITKISPVGGVVSILLVASIPMLVHSLLKQIGVLDHPFFFLAQHIGPSMFEAEALGLGAMYETGTIRVPKPYKVGLLPTGGSFIIMEFIQFGASRGYQRLVKSMGPLFANVVIEPCLLHGDLWSGNISSDINGEPVMPKQPGYEERRDLYMLYHYLNHYNLFGSGYRSSAMPIIDDYLAFLKA